MPLAVSTTSLLDKVGSYAGLASVLGLALLALLYFTQAREIKRLRDWAAGAVEREGDDARAARDAALAAQRRVTGSRSAIRPGAGPPAATAAGGGAASGAAAARPPAPAGPLAAGAAGSTPVSAAGGQTSGAVAPPAGPGRASPPGAPPTGPQPSAAAGSAAAVRAPGGATVVQPAVPGPAGPPDGAGSPGRAGAPSGAGSPSKVGAPSGAGPGTAAGRSAAAATAERPTDPRAAVSAGRPVTTRAGAAPLRAPSTSRPAAGLRGRGGTQAAAPDRNGSGRDRLPLRALALLAGVAALVAVVVVIAITQLNGSGTHTRVAGAPVASTDSSAATPPAHHRAGATPTAGVDHSTVTVSVLNGTTTPGLAKQVLDQLLKLGFRGGPTANAATQQLATTQVAYAAGDRAAARAVAQSLGLPVTAVTPADSGVRALAGPTAQVVVTVGGDHATHQ